VNAVNQAGVTPLHNAASQGSAVIVEILASKGAKLDVKNKRGQTPLAMTMVQAGAAGSFVPDEARKSAAEMLRKLGVTE
jgi:ankyrin repeat protein